MAKKLNKIEQIQTLTEKCQVLADQLFWAQQGKDWVSPKTQAEFSRLHNRLLRVKAQ